jgi:GNAT superfamily N-acetyltransferase
MQYAQENFPAFIDECGSLIEDHWRQVALDQDTIPLDPDWEKYLAMDEMCIVHLTTARYHGELVGYAVYLLSNALHYKTLEVAEADMFWLAPEHRKGWAGVHLIKCAEASLKDLGVHKVFNKVKLHADVGKVFEYLGHTAVERVYAKGLV